MNAYLNVIRSNKIMHKAGLESAERQKKLKAERAADPNAKFDIRNNYQVKKQNAKGTEYDVIPRQKNTYLYKPDKATQERNDNFVVIEQQNQGKQDYIVVDNKRYYLSKFNSIETETTLALISVDAFEFATQTYNFDPKFANEDTLVVKDFKELREVAKIQFKEAGGKLPTITQTHEWDKDLEVHHYYSETNVETIFKPTTVIFDFDEIKEQEIKLNKDKIKSFLLTYGTEVGQVEVTNRDGSISKFNNLYGDVYKGKIRVLGSSDSLTEDGWREVGRFDNGENAIVNFNGEFSVESRILIYSADYKTIQMDGILILDDKWNVLANGQIGEHYDFFNMDDSNCGNVAFVYSGTGKWQDHVKIVQTQI